MTIDVRRIIYTDNDANSACNITAASSITSIDVARNDNTSYTLTRNSNVARKNNTPVIGLVDFSCIDVRDTIRIIAVTYIDADDASVVSQNGTTTIFIIDVTCIVDSLFP